MREKLWWMKQGPEKGRQWTLRQGGYDEATAVV